ncbi:MAG: 4-(cytidine 5'-diphospho)-2-C-methyl-D-erythritol kinase [Rhodospirillales bacterium]|nr:4-(cytidine 5'-diphospho)-2-C-methyl-D-erythritol kinase [Rhodospirillales bacterium]
MISQFAPAKINLYLHVTGKRPDGYHTLDSLIVFADVGDQITVSPGKDLSLTLKGPFGDTLSQDPNNLVLQAAKKLAEIANVSTGAHITLIKNLPIASGIGGGSADAAATLHALQELWGCEIEKPEIDKIALSLGADVPICLDGSPSFVGGIGEEITRAPKFPKTWMVLVNPGIAVSTPTVFKNRHGSFSKAAPFIKPPQDSQSFIDLLKERHNDLTDPAIALTPEIEAVLEAIAKTKNCLLSRMSGSGATCFGLFKNQQDAQTAQAEISRIHKAWWCVSARLMPAQ